MYFGIKYAVDRYRICYVHPNSADTGGRMFAEAIKLVVVVQASL